VKAQGAPGNYQTLAWKAAIHVAETQPVRLTHGHAVASCRGIDGDLYVAHMRELFRRMVFNILIHNTGEAIDRGGV
jgi:hypothetical protein